MDRGGFFKGVWLFAIDRLADNVSEVVRATFPEWVDSVVKTFKTYPADWPDANLAATRIHWDLFVRAVEGHHAYPALVIETYPRPRLLIGVIAVAEFAPGDAGATVEFLKGLPQIG